MNNSPTAISAPLVMGLAGPEHTIVPLMASVSYDREDPYAVRLAFHVGPDDPVEWTLARDLLAAALHSAEGGREGIGDVQAWPSAASDDDGTVLNIAMSSPTGAAQFETSATVVAEFLDRTYALVPAGQESSYLDFDAELTELLS